MKPDIYICPDVAGVRALYADLLAPPFLERPIVEQLEAQAGRLAEAHKNGDARMSPQIKSWFPPLVGAPDDKIMSATFSLADARQTIAREYGFSGWGAVVDEGASPPEKRFEDAVDVLLAGDADMLSKMLKDDPSLANARSRYGHRAGLLHYAAANGVETWRQVAPLNLPVLIGVLIGAGADPNAEAPIYGGARPLGLLTTSAHPRDAGVTDEAAAVLRAAGAK